jgi:hypothetical protein
MQIVRTFSDRFRVSSGCCLLPNRKSKTVIIAGNILGTENNTPPHLVGAGRGGGHCSTVDVQLFFSGALQSNAWSHLPLSSTFSTELVVFASPWTTVCPAVRYSLTTSLITTKQLPSHARLNTVYQLCIRVAIF